MAEIIEYRVLASGLHVTSYDDGQVHIEVPSKDGVGYWQRIELRDIDVFELMSWMAGVKLPKTDNEVTQ